MRQTASSYIPSVIYNTRTASSSFLDRRSQHSLFESMCTKSKTLHTKTHARNNDSTVHVQENYTELESPN